MYGVNVRRSRDDVNAKRERVSRVLFRAYNESASSDGRRDARAKHSLQDSRSPRSVSMTEMSAFCVLFKIEDFFIFYFLLESNDRSNVTPAP